MADQPETRAVRYQALIELLRTSESLWNASRLFFARWDLGPSQFNLLNVLTDFPEGLSQIELSRKLIMHRSNITGLVDRLENRGLLRREASKEDRRIYRVLLTAEGRKLLRQVLPRYHQAAEEVWGKIPSRRILSFIAELQELTVNAERIAKEES